jgi:hypothetical protein
MNREFAAFVRDMKINHDRDTQRSGRWWSVIDPHFKDFCKEIVEPGTNKHFARGAVSIRTDQDFWIAAAIPYKFRDVSCAEIVAALWPNIEAPYIFPDSGSYWWVAINDDSLEVPGEPYETWAETVYPDGFREETRIHTLSSLSEAEEKVALLRKTKISSDHQMTIHIKQWTAGGRNSIADHPVIPSAAA